jgi:hypothetical protein
LVRSQRWALYLFASAFAYAYASASTSAFASAFISPSAFEVDDLFGCRSFVRCLSIGVYLIWDKVDVFVSV